MSILSLIGMQLDFLKEEGRSAKLILLSCHFGEKMNEVLLDDLGELDEETKTSILNTISYINAPPYWGKPKRLEESMPSAINYIPILVNPHIERDFIVTGKAMSNPKLDRGRLDNALEACFCKDIKLIIVPIGELGTREETSYHGIPAVEAPNINNFVLITGKMEDIGWTEELDI